MAAPTQTRNYYELLHVSRDAPVEIIRTSYRTLMQQLKKHPDLGGDTATAALINEAYSVLTDSDKRAAYDAYLDAPAASEAPPDPGRPEPAPRRILDPGRECVFCEYPHGQIVESDSCCRVCNSPLFAARRQRIESAGQRSIERIGAQHAVRFYTRWPQRRPHSGRTEDLSLNGMRLVTDYGLKVGQCIKIVSDVLQAVATATHCSVERRGLRLQTVAGLSFVTLRFSKISGGFVSHQA